MLTPTTSPVHPEVGSRENKVGRRREGKRIAKLTHPHQPLNIWVIRLGRREETHPELGIS